MPDRESQIPAFCQIADDLRTMAVANARALEEHRCAPAAAILEKQLEHTLDRLARFYGRGSYENLTTQRIFQIAVDEEIQFAQELDPADRAGALSRAHRLVDASRRGRRLNVKAYPARSPARVIYVEPFRPEFRIQLLSVTEPFLTRENGAVVVRNELEINELRAAGDDVFILFLNAPDFLDLIERHDRLVLDAELVQRLAQARAAPDRIGDSRPAYIRNQLLQHDVGLRNLRDRLAAEAPAARRELLPILAEHRQLLERELIRAPQGRPCSPLEESIAREREFQYLLSCWTAAAEADNATGMLGSLKVVAESGSFLNELARLET